MSRRLAVDKTLKLYVDGKFIRSESGRTLAVTHEGRIVNVPRASRKDLRDAVRAARAAQPGWAAATGYLRGQILYRLAEMLDDRGAPAAAVDRAVFYAGWSDKITALLSSIGPVASSYLNYSRLRPVGVVVAGADPADGLLGLIELACASVVMGNSAVLAVEVSVAPAAVLLAEALATSDLPGGVINVLTGPQDELLVEAARHDDVDLLLLGGAAGSGVRTKLAAEGAATIQRLVSLPAAEAPASPFDLQRLAEVQTVWVSAYAARGGGAAY